MTIDPAAVSNAVGQLRALMAAPDTNRQVSDLARQRVEAIDRSQNYLSERHHCVAFVGEIGIGKSSMIGVLGGLLVGGAPTDRASLSKNSVLAVGAGGTTVCEVRIRGKIASDRGPIGLIIEPYTVEEMKREIRIFATDEWVRRKAGEKARSEKTPSDDDRDATPREFKNVIRNMTGLAERAETVLEAGQKKKRAIDPLDDVIVHHDSPGSLTNQLVERASLLSRTDTAWWWDAGDDAYRSLKQRFDDINFGRTPTATLPHRITIVVADLFPGLADGLDIEVIDTRGFDGQLAGRSDIQLLLRDPRTLVVVCLPFKNAPGDSVKALLRDILADAEFRQAAERMPLVLMDQGDGEGVNGCNGDREFGQQLKQGECRRSLEGAGLDAFAAESNLAAFDTLRDDPAGLLRTLGARLGAMRTAVEARLAEQVSDAVSFLSNLENVRIELARAEVDRRLVTTLEANSPTGAPLRDPLEGLYSGILACRYASQVYASFRRDGRYPNMDAFGAVRSGASRAATEWLKSLNLMMLGTFKSLEHDDEFRDVREHIRLRNSQYVEAHVAAVRDYADAVLGEVEDELDEADIWEACAGEWGRGNGFKDRAIVHLKDWSRTHGQIRAHGQMNLAALLPWTTASVR